MQQSAILNSWKEISNYLGRGVRTVQRWEKDFGLPVRRPCGHLRGSVFATKDDIDGWLNSREARTATITYAPTEQNQIVPEVQQASIDSFHRNAVRFEERCQSFRDRLINLTSTLERTKVLREEMKARWSDESKVVN